MGEPLTASILCGAVALGMTLWNWQMVMHAQRRKGRNIAMEAARVARERAQIRASACNQPRTRSFVTPTEVVVAAAATDMLEIASRRPLQLDSPPDCPANTPVGDPSPFIIKAARERLATAPLSPPLSSPREAEIGFFKEGAPSGLSRVYQATQMRTDGVYYRGSAGTEPAVLKEARLTGAAFSGATSAAAEAR